MKAAEYIRIPKSIIDNKNLNAYDIGLFAQILRYFNDKTNFRMADLLCVSKESENTIRKALNKLVENGCLEKVSRLSGWRIVSSNSEETNLKICGNEPQNLMEEAQNLSEEPQNLREAKEERTKEESIDIPHGDSLNNTSSSCRSIYLNANVEQTDEVQDKPSFDDACREIVTYLNEKTGQKFSPKSAATRELIQARLDEDFVVDDFKTVIDKKCDEWIDDQKMKMYLRPITLFGKNFERYLTEDIRIRRGANGWDIDLDADDDMKDIFTDETWGGWNGRNTHH